MKRIIAIIGSQRSGTTMLGRWLNHHRDITSFVEAQESYPRLQRAAFDGEEYPTLFSAFQVPGYTQHILHKWKSWESINPVLLFMIRNPLDCISSMIRHFEGKWIMRNILGIRDKVALDQLDESDFCNLNIVSVAAAHFWKGQIDVYLKLAKLTKNIHPVFYDDAFSNPEQFISDVCCKIGCDFDPSLVDFKVRDERGKNESLLSDQNIAKIWATLGGYSDYRSMALEAKSSHKNPKFI